MRVPRIYLPVPLQSGSVVELDERSRRHVVQVLRLTQGDELVVFNDDGVSCRAVLHSVDKRTAMARLLDAETTGDSESPLAVTLAQGVSRGERMDFTIQKSVELGVRNIQPLWTTRSQVRLSGDRLEKRVRHWQGVAIAACEQSGRSHVPRVQTPVTLAEWLDGNDRDVLKLLLDPDSPTPLAGLRPDNRKIELLVGPEGGLSAEEKQLARMRDYHAIRLGPRILRTETAAMVALSVLQWEWGDLNNQ